MIKEGLKFLVSLGNPEPFRIGEYYYHDKKLVLVEVPRVETVEVRSLQGFIDFVNESKSKKSQYIHVSPDSVRLMSKSLTYSYRRDCYCEFKIDKPLDIMDRAVIKAEIKSILIIV